MSAAALAWYLIRTKPGKEQYLHRELSRRLPETFMPLLETRSRRQTISLVPLFPQYLFARLELAVHYFEIRYMLGVVGFISTSGEPLAVAQTIVDNIRARCPAVFVVDEISLSRLPWRYSSGFRRPGFRSDVDARLELAALSGLLARPPATRTRRTSLTARGFRTILRKVRSAMD
jgi:transcription antitermination factor NusG